MFTSNKFQQRNFTLEILECPIIAVNCFASCIEATYLDENVRRPPIGNNRTQFAVILTYVINLRVNASPELIIQIHTRPHLSLLHLFNENKVRKRYPRRMTAF